MQWTMSHSKEEREEGEEDEVEEEERKQQPKNTSNIKKNTQKYYTEEKLHTKEYI